jgi:hypothetical protein
VIYPMGSIAAITTLAQYPMRFWSRILSIDPSIICKPTGHGLAGRGIQIFDYNRKLEQISRWSSEFQYHRAWNMKGKDGWEIFCWTERKKERSATLYLWGHCTLSSLLIHSNFHYVTAKEKTF